MTMKATPKTSARIKMPDRLPPIVARGGTINRRVSDAFRFLADDVRVRLLANGGCIDIKRSEFDALARWYVGVERIE
jgi:hypothetical protein